MKALCTEDINSSSTVVVSSESCGCVTSVLLHHYFLSILLQHDAVSHVFKKGKLLLLLLSKKYSVKVAACHRAYERQLLS